MAAKRFSVGLALWIAACSTKAGTTLATSTGGVQTPSAGQGTTGTPASGASSGSSGAGSAHPGSSGTSGSGSSGGGGSSGGSTGATPIPDAGIPNLSCQDAGTLSAIEQSLLDMPADSWMDLPASDFATFCLAHELPSVEAQEGCEAVINDWSGGAFDDAQRTLILWGGGHGGYYGNEVYGFDLATGTWSLLRPPTPLDAGQLPTEPMYDGTPVSRHTYDGLAYLENLQQLMAWGGATAPIGYSVDTSWLFDPATQVWTQRANAPGDEAGHFFMATAYDIVSGHVYVRDDQGIWDHDVQADTWTHVVDYGYPPYYPKYTTYNYRRAVVVPHQRYLYALGGTLAGGAPDYVVFDIATASDITDTITMGGDVSVISVDGPGLDYDSAADELVAWSGGAPAIMDLPTLTWVRGSAAGAPAAAEPNGTYGRFRYVSYLNVFILVNQPTENVHFYKHTAGCGP